MGKFKDLTGQVFGRLTVIKRCGLSNDKHILWECLCECGNKTFTQGRLLQNKTTKSCGCYQKEQTSKASKKYNDYELFEQYGIGHSINNEVFYFDLEDYDLIKNYCWYVTKKGYARASNSKIFLHRLVLGIKDKNIQVDHKDRNPRNNRKYNLRISTQMENARNKSKMPSNTSGITGVYFYEDRNKWYSRIYINHSYIKLYYGNNKDEAIYARLKAEKLYFGEYSPQINLFEQYGVI
jgi:hypothetical protein